MLERNARQCRMVFLIACPFSKSPDQDVMPLSLRTKSSNNGETANGETRTKYKTLLRKHDKCIANDTKIITRWTHDIFKFKFSNPTLSIVSH